MGLAMEFLMAGVIKSGCVHLRVSIVSNGMLSSCTNCECSYVELLIVFSSRVCFKDNQLKM